MIQFKEKDKVIFSSEIVDATWIPRGGEKITFKGSDITYRVQDVERVYDGQNTKPTVIVQLISFEKK